MKSRTILLIILILVSVVFVITINTAAYSEENVNFSIIYKDLEISLNEFSLFLTPGEKIEFKAVSENNKSRFSFVGVSGNYIYRNGNTLGWQAPDQPGHYKMRVKNISSQYPNSTMNLNIFVLHPFNQKKAGYIGGFRLGSFPVIPADKRNYYKVPKGFLEIRESMLNISLSPHFKLSQFLTNQTESTPQYIVIQESLILKLEKLLAEVNKRGIKAETFKIVSAFRTPYFNKKIGNNTDLSRHVFGDAADIYIDSSGNDWMDDLNNDGKINIRDADVLMDIVVDFDNSTDNSALLGGTSSYKTNHVRGPFVHVDTRGFHVIW